MGGRLTARVVGGVFVGGASRRMNRRPKGLLQAPGGGSIVERLFAVLEECGIDDTVLVGACTEYSELGLPSIEDQPPGIGPLGGLVSLLRRSLDGFAVALACDMPFVSDAIVRSLLDAPAAAVVAPRCGGKWQPLCARYAAAEVLPLAEQCVARGEHSLQRLLTMACATPLPLPEGRCRELRDWDTPEDVVNDR